MTPTPPSSTSSHTPQSPDAQFRIVRKRNRIPLSCGPCRHRKLKCNRGHPCDNCVKRGDVDSCAYAAPSARKKHNTHNNSANGTPDEMQNRIDRLESLVLSLMTNGVQSAGPAAATAAIAGLGPNSGSSMSGSSPRFQLDVESIREEPEDGEEDDSEVEKVSKSMGVMKVDSGKTIFASEAHWYSILAEITEVKTYFADHRKQFEEAYNSVRQKNEEMKQSTVSFFPFITEKRATHAEILSAFPPKPTTDNLITRFFNTHNYDPAFHILHGPTYQRQYDQHWITPSETPVIWLAMTYAMMVISVQSYIRAGDEPSEYRGILQQMLTDYRRLTVQCLILVDITAPIDYVLETLLLHVIAEFGRSRDAETGVLLGMSTIVRLAMRMGYHRDSKDFAAVTPFQGEMRRRIWAVIRQGDVLFSAQQGLPPMVRPDDTNTALPRNLWDDELRENMKELPTEHSTEVNTPMNYVIYKGRLIDMFGEITEEVQTLHPTTYEQVMKLDHKLQEVHKSIPTPFRMRPMNEVLQDTSVLVMQRYILDLLFLKTQCVLHRKFICPSRDSTRYAYSRRTCIDNAMLILQHQATLHNESRPGGRLSNVKWFISSLTTSDFLLAAMIIALDLYHTTEAERQGRRASNDVYDWSHERRTAMLETLEQSRQMWESLQDQSTEALKASNVLAAMIDKLRAHEAQLRQAAQQSGFGSNGFPQSRSSEDSSIAPEHSAAMTLGMLSTGAHTPDAANMFAQAQYSTPTSSQATSGLNPQFLATADGSNGAASAPSPFSSMFGPSSGMLNIDMSSNNIDWNAWDSFLQTPNVNAEPSNSSGVSGYAPGAALWGGGGMMNFDMNGGIDLAATYDANSGAASQTQSPPSNTNFQMAGLFMGGQQSKNGL